MFRFAIEGLKSTNWRVKVECLDELTSILQRQGLTVCIPQKAFPIIAAYVQEKDPVIRAAALGFFTQAYAIGGDELWKYLGTDINRSALETHIRNTQVKSDAAPSPARPASSLGLTSTPAKSKPAGLSAKSPRRAPSPTTPRGSETSTFSMSTPSPSKTQIPRSKSTDFRLEMDKIGGIARLSNNKMPTLAATDSPARGDTTPRLPAKAAAAEPTAMDWDSTGEANLDGLLQQVDEVEAAYPESAVESLKLLSIAIKQGEATFSEAACDRMLLTCSRFAKKIYDNQPFNPRCFKYAWTLINQIAKQQALYCNVSAEALFEVLKFAVELTLPVTNPWITEDDKRHVGSCGKEFLSHGLECDIITTFSVLLRMMSLNAPKEFLDLVLRVFIRHTKRLAATAALVDRSRTIQILRDVNTFLVQSTRSEEDPALRGVKAMLNELVRGQQQCDLLECASTIPQPAPVLVVIQHIIRSNQESTAQDIMASLTPTVTSTLSSASFPSQQISSNEKRELQDIIRRVLNNETSKQGIAELCNFRKAHPQIDVTQFLSQTTIVSQTSILRQMDAHDKGDDGSDALEVGEDYMSKLRDIRSRMQISTAPVAPTVIPSYNNAANLPVYAPTTNINDIKQRIKSATAQNMDMDKENIGSAAAPSAISTTSSLGDIRQRLARIRAP